MEISPTYLYFCFFCFSISCFSKTPNEDINSEEIIDHCKKYLTGYKIPEFVEFVEEIPKSNVGKILRRKLRDIENG